MSGATTDPTSALLEEWHYSRDEEWFQSDACASREDAIAEALGELDLAPGDAFYIGRAVPTDPKDVADHVTDADQIVDRIGEYFYENLGEQAPERDLAPTPEQLLDLGECVAAAIAAWLVRHDVVKTHGMDRTEDLVAAACPKCDDTGSSPGLPGQPFINCGTCGGSGVVLAVA